MTEYFKALNEEEYDKLKDAIAIITVYISGADGVIEDEELSWAEKLTKIRSYSLPEGLKGYYQEVGIDFHDRVENYINSLPRDVEGRNQILSEKLSDLNPILSKLPPMIGAKMYKSFMTFAEHVAKSTGGFLGFFKIDAKEHELLQLPMIDPIEYDEDEN